MDRKQLTCDSFVFYRSFYEAIRVLPLENQGKIYDAIFKFSFENIEVDLTGIDLAVFLLVKPQLIANRKRYENGCKGGRPKKETETEFSYPSEEPKQNQTETKIKPKQNQTETKPKPNDNDNVNVNDNVNDNVVVVFPQTPLKEKIGNDHDNDNNNIHFPTLEDVKSYCIENGIVTDYEKFYLFNSARGWTISGRPIKDWKACLRMWLKTETEVSEKNTETDYLKHAYTEEQLKSVTVNFDDWEE